MSRDSWPALVVSAVLAVALGAAFLLPAQVAFLRGK
jgi:hypothetical protein